MGGSAVELPLQTAAVPRNRPLNPASAMGAFGQLETVEPSLHCSH
jgi:hypothetical protein